MYSNSPPSQFEASLVASNAPGGSHPATQVWLDSPGRKMKMIGQKDVGMQFHLVTAKRFT